MKFLTYAQASAFLTEELGIPMAETTLRRMVSEKRIPHTKLDKRVMFNPERLFAWLQEKAVEPHK